MSNASIRLGDVFTIPLDEERIGFGQVVATYGKTAYCFAIFDRAYPRSSPPSLADVVADRIAFLALSMHAKIFVGDWPIVGNTALAEAILPAYKEVVGTPDRVDVVDFSGTQRRRASPAEAELLPYRKTVAPIRLEKALRASHGLVAWDDAYEAASHRGVNVIDTPLLVRRGGLPLVRLTSQPQWGRPTRLS